MTVEEFMRKYPAETSVQEPTQNPAEKVADEAAAAARSTGARAASVAKDRQAKAATAPSQADSQPPLPKSASAAPPPTPMLSPATFTGPSPDAAPPTPINAGNIVQNVFDASPLGAATNAVQSGYRALGEAERALPGQAKTLAEKLKAQALNQARAWSVQPR